MHKKMTLGPLVISDVDSKPQLSFFVNLFVLYAVTSHGFGYYAPLRHLSNVWMIFNYVHLSRDNSCSERGFPKTS
jgi:hypothetical protein